MNTSTIIGASTTAANLGSITLGSTITAGYPSPAFSITDDVYGGNNLIMNNCKQVENILRSLNGFYEIVANSTEEENLIVLEMLSMKIERVSKLINASIDSIEKKKSVSMVGGK